MAGNRKVCFTGPTRLTLAEDMLRNAGCELVMGKNADEYRTFRYERRELIRLIGDAPSLSSGRTSSARIFWILAQTFRRW
jgi:hypothetical protein